MSFEFSVLSFEFLVFSNKFFSFTAFYSSFQFLEKIMKLLNRILLIALFAMVCKVGLAQVPERPANAAPVVDLAGIINKE